MINSVAITPETSKRSLVLEHPKKSDFTPPATVDSLTKTDSSSKKDITSEKSDMLLKPLSEAHPVAAAKASEAVHETKATSDTLKTLASKDHEPLEENVHHFGKKLLERVNIGWKNMAYLTSAQCQKSKIGRVASKLDIPFFLLGFVPFLHFFWLIQPSVVLFALGAVLKKPIGHEYLGH